MRQAVKECIDNQECKVEDNNSHGKYHSQKFEAYVTSEEERNEFFKRLQNHKDIKFVL
jgi:putative lipoic acid-binding regulatory protein